MVTVTANELKTKGVSSIEKVLQDAQEVIISVHGKPRYVMMDIEQYDYLREREIEAAWFQAREDVSAGRYRKESADNHITRVKADLNDEI